LGGVLPTAPLPPGEAAGVLWAAVHTSQKEEIFKRNHIVSLELFFANANSRSPSAKAKQQTYQPW